MDTKEFDSIVKSMMDGAQEEVSSRVWLGVQSSLAAKAAASSRIIFFRRAGFAVAALAAAVALLLWTGLFRSTNSIQPNISDDAIAQVEGQTAVVPEVIPEAVVPTETPEASDRAGLQKPFHSSASRPESAYEGAPVAPVTPVTEGVETQEAESQDVTTQEVVTNEAVATEVTETVEETVVEVVEEDERPTLEEILREELSAERSASRSGRGVRFAFGGNIESNGISTSTYTPPVRRRMSAPTKSSVRENGNTEYSLPVSFGVSVKIPVVFNFSVGTGINFTELKRSFSGQYVQVQEPGVYDSIYSDITNTIRYIGIPVNLYYDFPGAGKFAFYSYVGGMIERGLTNKFRIEHPEKDKYFNGEIKGAQFSLSFGLGVEYKITNHIGIYIDPSLKYYFDCNQPKSIRTQQPWMVNLEAGLRFSL